ncbi:MAG: DsbC family protein [Alteraurantiacibacter sp.]
MRKLIIALAGGATVLSGTALYAATTLGSDVTEALSNRLPKTKLTAVDCDKIDGLCEVQAGSNLFYTDAGGRYLIVGRVYDMETKQDLTAARLLEINPASLLGGAGGASADADGPNQLAGSGTRKAPAMKTQVSLAGLPASGAIKWGAGKHTVTVFSDFRCGYCKRLHDTLADMDVKVVERPISIMGTRPLSNAVMCADDSKSALRAAYGGQLRGGAGQCDTSGLDANEAFAKRNGFTGTPVIVRSDGAVVHGYRPRAFLENWLKGAS